MSVRDTGAAGDGQADDSDSILRARAEAGMNGTVVFPAGSYRFAQTLAMDVPGQTWILRSGARLLADAQLRLDAQHVKLLGPGGLDARGATRMAVEIRTQGTDLMSGALIDGVELSNLGRKDYAALLFVGGSYAQIRNSFFHDSGGDGAMINTDGGPGLSGVEFRNNRFDNIVGDAIHSKGTNGPWNDGSWIPQDKRNVGHKFIGNVMTNVGQRAPHFSLEIQDGHQGAEIRDNWADRTYSIVGQVSAVISGNTYVGDDDWGMEVGNIRDTQTVGNRFHGCRTAIAMTGASGELNVGNRFNGNTCGGCETLVSVAWDGGDNRFE